METKEYFEKVMQDYNQHRNGRSLRKYCKDEAVDYDWLLAFKKDYPSGRAQTCPSSPAGFISLLVSEEHVVVKNWQVDFQLAVKQLGAYILLEEGIRILYNEIYD